MTEKACLLQQIVVAERLKGEAIRRAGAAEAECDRLREENLSLTGQLAHAKAILAALPPRGSLKEGSWRYRVEAFLADAKQT